MSFLCLPVASREEGKMELPPPESSAMCPPSHAPGADALLCQVNAAGIAKPARLR
jgi:hypothetical protein